MLLLTVNDDMLVLNFGLYMMITTNFKAILTVTVKFKHGSSSSFYF